MTQLERESLEAFRLVIDQLSAGRPLKRMEHMEFMGEIRKITTRLENKSYGCATGLHSAHCTCKEGVQGVALWPISRRRADGKNEQKV